MNKIPEHNLHMNKKGPSVPCFLQNKQLITTPHPEDRVKKFAFNSQEYQKLVISNPASKNLFQKRAAAYIKNTPKIIVVEQKNEPFKVYVQTPKKFLIQNLKPYRRSVQLQKCIEISLTLFNIADTYGYFYCDKLMLKMSEDGSPVIWLHQRFKQNQREFPIKQSSVSELIFTKKLKETLNELAVFPKNLQLDTKKKLIAYLESEKSKLEKPVDQFPKIPASLINKSIRNNFKREASIANFSYRNQGKQRDQSNSIKVFTPSKFMRNPAFYPKSNRESLNKSKQKYQSPHKMYEAFERNKDRIKTTKFEETQKIFDVSSVSGREKSEKLNRNVSKPSVKDENAEKNSKKISLLSPQKHKSSTQNNISINKNEDSLKQDTICLEFEFDPQVINQFKVPKKNKSRKGSVDVNVIMSWNQKEKPQEAIPFQHSTFSTSVTFSSLKAELENSCEQEDKQRKVEAKHQNYVIPHLYSVDREKETKEKLYVGRKKHLKESEIAEQEFQNDVESLFESCLLERKKNQAITARQSMLIQELQKLFQSTQKGIAQQLSLTEDLNDLLS